MICDRDNNTIGQDLADALNKIPILRYPKDPVVHIEDLYKKYPQGGEYGWYAFVYSKKTFAYWDIKNKSWELLSKGDLQSILDVDVELLKEGDIPVWDETKEQFVIVNSNMWGKVEW